MQAATPGNANTDLAIVTLQPSESTHGALPQGERPGGFAEAPVKGPVATGEATGISVPGLTIREEPKRVEQPASRLTSVLYSERVRGIPTATLSRPASPGVANDPANDWRTLSGVDMCTRS